jgi:hypothetical protein
VIWEHEYDRWAKQTQAVKECVNIGDDCVNPNSLKDNRQRILLLMEAPGTAEEDSARTDGHRKSVESGHKQHLGINCRSLTIDSKLAIGEGTWGFGRLWSKL